MIALNGFFLLGGCLGSTDLGSIPVDTMAFEEGVGDFAKPNMTIFNSNYWMIIILDILCQLRKEHRISAEESRP